MALSDEDYGILYNFVADTEDEDPFWLDSAMILLRYHQDNGERSKLSQTSREYKRDYAAFIILSEGRELP